MSRDRKARAKLTAAARLCLIVSVGIACCAACGQTGPLTLAEPGDPVDGQPQSTASDDPESDEPEQDAEER